MPELPEVEFCARRLRSWAVGRRVDEVLADAGRPLTDAPGLAGGLLVRRRPWGRRVGKLMVVDV
ncbi:MAG: hypothetical protein KC620_20995 [Myxococcales bacterium]|nr:hypothetical protein [Myxococcales bacterium]